MDLPFFAAIVLCFAPVGVICDTRNWNPTGQGCVDPNGFLSCYATQSSNAVSCVGFCDSNTVKGTGAYTDCILGCNGAWLASNVGCWIQSCWNQVYSCEYQLTAISYFDGTDLVQNANIPFYPPPDSASAGACSCNLGYVYGNKTYINFNNACIDVAGSGDMNALYECECCEFGFPVSNILNVCPKSDLSILGFAQELSDTQQLIGKSADNCAILDNNSDTCVQQFGYPFYGTVTNPLNLPAGEPGDEPLSNLAGNAFTDFGAPAYTLKLFPGYSSVITPAAFNADAGVATGSVGASGSAVVTATAGSTGTGGSVAATGTAKNTGTATGKTGSATTATGKTTGTGTGAAASTSTTKSAGVRLGSKGSTVLGGVVFSIVLFAL
ncbi:uncharacterized protein PAC_19544 [Phialocephala subalpina]|uniref:Uncharacterized protein n=1 Tax=Phialocephala subalpina TaxID=576137 RepID=A0A1L7XX73_9HELO|nr:uncharacterized protein PAC_19544 [Phialocephala subalpina]